MSTFQKLLIPQNQSTLSMSKIHIGKKIREVLDKSPMSMVDFAKKINLSRDGAYKMMDKETIATDQLQKIGSVLNHDFFAYYQPKSTVASEKNATYGFATKEDVEVLTKLVHSLIKEVEKLRENNSSKKKATKKRN